MKGLSFSLDKRKLRIIFEVKLKLEREVQIKSLTFNFKMNARIIIIFFKKSNPLTLKKFKKKTHTSGPLPHQMRQMMRAVCSVYPRH